MKNDILLRLENIQAKNQAIKFTNTYYGMPVVFSGNILRITSSGVEFNVPRPQILCMRKNRTTYLKSPGFPGVVKAQVSWMDLEGERVELTNFEYTNHNIGKRSLVRVELKEPIHAVIMPLSGGRPYGVRIVEISLRGLAVIVGAQFYDRRYNAQGAKVLLNYQLPTHDPDDVDPVITYEGIIKNSILTHGNAEYRIGIEVFPDNETEHIITRYIAQRQRDLLKEIRDLTTFEEETT